MARQLAGPSAGLANLSPRWYCSGPIPTDAILWPGRGFGTTVKVRLSIHAFEVAQRCNRLVLSHWALCLGWLRYYVIPGIVRDAFAVELFTNPNGVPRLCEDYPGFYCQQRCQRSQVPRRMAFAKGWIVNVLR